MRGAALMRLCCVGDVADLLSTACGYLVFLPAANGGGINGLRALRAMRPLRALKAIPGAAAWPLKGGVMCPGPESPKSQGLGGRTGARVRSQ